MVNIPYLIFKLVLPTATGGTETVEISKKSVYRLVAWNGIESVDTVVNTLNNANVPGAYVVGKHTNPRRISIEFAIDDKKLTEELRRKLIRILNPEKEGILYVERNNKSGRINFVIENAVTYRQANIRENKLKILINLICPDPYFRDAEDTTVTFLKFVPMYRYPLAFPVGVGAPYGVQITTDGLSITNEGDVDIGIVVGVDVYGGDIVNPAINCGDESIRVLTTLHDGDSMIIDMRPRLKNIYINGVSTFNFDRTSKWFLLSTGQSDISVSADSGVSNAKTTITYANKWLGV